MVSQHDFPAKSLRDRQFRSVKHGNLSRSDTSVSSKQSHTPVQYMHGADNIIKRVTQHTSLQNSFTHFNHDHLHSHYERQQNHKNPKPVLLVKMQVLGSCGLCETWGLHVVRWVLYNDEVSLLCT